MEVWIVFEYAEPTNKIIGVFKNEEDAIKAHMEHPTPRYIELHEVE